MASLISGVNAPLLTATNYCLNSKVRLHSVKSQF